MYQLSVAAKQALMAQNRSRVLFLPPRGSVGRFLCWLPGGLPGCVPAVESPGLDGSPHSHKDGWGRGRGREGGMVWVLGVSRCKVLHIEWRNNKVLLYSTGNYIHYPVINHNGWASLVAQWLRIRLPMQGTPVRALVREDPTCRGAPKPVRHNY